MGMWASIMLASSKQTAVFLRMVQNFAEENLGLSFRGPYVNKKHEGMATSWIISLFKREDRLRLIRNINSIHLGLEYPVAQ